jgi:VWFA-related protein
MTQRDRDRLIALKKAKKGLITQRQAAEEIGQTERHIRRLLVKRKREGDQAVVHGRRGRRSNRKLSEKSQAKAVAILGQEKYRGFGPTLASEYLGKHHQITVSRETVRAWMIEARLWQARKQRVEKVHAWRQRRSRCGELVQWDTSEHQWLEERGPKLYLISMIDDATSRLHARFVLHDSTAENMRLLWSYLERYGRPVSFYIYAAVDRVKYSIMSRAGPNSFDPLGSRDLFEAASGHGGSGGGTSASGRPAATGSSPDAAVGAQIAALRTSIFSVGTLGAIRYVVDGLRELPGRKTLVLFSENLQLFNGNSPNHPDRRVLESLRNLIDAANRASVAIYTIDTRGLNDYGLTAADDTSHMTGGQMSGAMRQRADEVFNSQGGLVMLAQQTGGLFYQNNNDILAQTESAVKDSDGYYLIAYHPPADTFDDKTGQPKFHNVRVQVKTAGLTVRSRAGFLNHSDAAAEAPARAPAERMRRARYSPFNSDTIHVRLTTLFANSAAKGSFLRGLLHFEAKDLQFTDQPDGSHKAVIDVVASPSATRSIAVRAPLP